MSARGMWILVTLLVLSPCAAVDEDPVAVAIARGLSWLRSQQRADGMIDDGGGLQIVKTALSVTAHLAAGELPGDAPHGPDLRLAILAVLDRQEAGGWLGGDGGRMYGHAIATLMLAEVLGTTGDAVLEERLRLGLTAAVDLIVAAARVSKDDDHRGGWRYRMREGSSDMSVSGWQVMALHAASQIGIRVPDDVIVEAGSYVRRVVDSSGRVGYQRRGDDRPALRGGALLALAVTGPDDDPLLEAVAQRIVNRPIAWRGPHFFYRAWYDAVALARVRPALWDRYRGGLEAILIGQQRPDGSWASPPADNEARHGGAFTTAMALLTLCVDRRLLPVYQR